MADNKDSSEGGGKIRELKDKLHTTHLHSAMVKVDHLKNRIGKLGNLVNRNHRHDEPHEQRTDAKRTAIAESNRFGSFAPERDGNLVKWYIDGRDYFWAVSEALENAKETIYIEDWWLSPEIFLRRPPYSNQHWRLDTVLKRRAEAGVKIYVIVYKEVQAALSCNSRHTKEALRNLCPPGKPGHGNIHIMRHPDHNVFENAGDMTFYWAHHEKFIIVDYEVAFMGGFDLCFGRWDTHQHVLADVSPAGVEHTLFPGQDFNNNRIKDFASVDDWKNNELSKADYGRMPWHDVSVGLIGPCIYDLAEHFILRWNFCKRDKYKRDNRFDYLLLTGRDGEDEDLIAVQRPKHPEGEYITHPLSPLDSKPLGPEHGTVKAQIVRSSADWSSGILTEHSIQTAYRELIAKAEHFIYIENQFFVTATGTDQAPIHNQIGEAIVEAVVRAAKEGRRFRVVVVLPGIPGFAGDLRSDEAAGTRAIMDYQYKSINRGENSIMGRLEAEGLDPHEHIFFFNLRSYDRINKTPAIKEQEEKSGVTYQEVQRANAEEIMGSGIHGVRQGSNSSASSGDYDKQGEEEKEKMVQRKELFESERENVGLGKFNDVDGDLVADSVDSIAKNALYGQPKVSDEMWNADQPEQEKENFVQEQLYPHDKIMIVDDRYALCGSANINDRSQLGYHDSELAIILEDTDLIDSTMAGEPFKAGRLPATLRRMLWREHLGLVRPQPPDATGDPNAQPPGKDSPNDVGERDGERGEDGEHGNDDERGQDGVRDNRERGDGEHGNGADRSVGERLEEGERGDGERNLDSERGQDLAHGQHYVPSRGTHRGHADGDPGAGRDDGSAAKWNALVADPLADDVWSLWTTQATTNTEVFRTLFHADPDDHVTTFELYDDFLPQRKATQKSGHLYDPYVPVKDVKLQLDRIKGHLVWMPLDFLKDETMAERGLQVNDYTESIFT